MHMEFRRFYGLQNSSFPRWIKNLDGEEVPALLKKVVFGKSGDDLGTWKRLYSLYDEVSEEISFDHLRFYSKVMAAVNGYQGNTPAGPPATNGSKQPAPPAKTVDSQSVLKRKQETVFEGTEYRLSLAFSNDYPFKPPKVKFETCCFHPNVHVYGHICLDILQDKWSSAYDVRTILLSIQSLLGEPNISSPLNAQAAQLWNNQDEYRKMVEKLYKPPSA